MGSSTGRTRAPSNSRHPGQSALSPARNGHFLEPTWPSRSPAACTPRWRRWCPSRRHTRCPTSPGTGPPPGPDTGHLRSPASEPNSIRSRTLECGTGRPPRCVSGATTSEAFSRIWVRSLSQRSRATGHLRTGSGVNPHQGKGADTWHHSQVYGCRHVRKHPITPTHENRPAIATPQPG